MGKEEDRAEMNKILETMVAAHRDAKEKGFKKGHAGQSSLPCPTGCGGSLRYSVAAYNGHMMAKCDTEGCVKWME